MDLAGFLVTVLLGSVKRTWNKWETLYGWLIKWFNN